MMDVVDSQRGEQERARGRPRLARSVVARKALTSSPSPLRAAPRIDNVYQPDPLDLPSTVTLQDKFHYAGAPALATPASRDRACHTGVSRLAPRLAGYHTSTLQLHASIYAARTRPVLRPSQL
ncbi:hypothetical protein NX905_29560, partial [Burkholderia thailandensis]|uniref:hypothetical protein n=1 Tax=Burkholderia thailandensis TaxID=57975 RepID=UPI00217E5F34